jgi:cyclin B
VAEYAPDILRLLLREETEYLPCPYYMDRQKDINAKMRAILMDWLVEVHMKYKLRDETLHLTVTIIDRYLARVPVPRKRLQLVGVVAMFIAAKFEEINPPGVGDYEYITDNAYTKDDILVTECQMLTTLNFQIVVPTVAHFMDPLQRMNGCDTAHKHFVNYLCELALLEIRMLKYKPSHLLSAAMLLSNELSGRMILWPRLLQESTQHAEEDLRPCVRELQELLEQAPAHWLQAVGKKYQSPQHHAVAQRWP